MVKTQEKIRARTLRQKETAIIAIAREIKVARRSVSLWCQDIEE